MDLNNTFKDKLFPKKNLSARICKVWTIQEAIQSLGGLPVLFPLLEQACFKTKKSDGSSVNELLNMVNSFNEDEDNHENCDTQGDVSKQENDTTPENLQNDNTQDDASNEGVDCVDGGRGQKPILSDLPVAYSPRKYYYPQYNENEPASWSHEVDEELCRIEVVNKETVNDTFVNKPSRESVDAGCGVDVSPSSVVTSKESWTEQMTTSKSTDDVLKRSHGSFVVLDESSPHQR